jgi:hypothetical protein
MSSPEEIQSQSGKHAADAADDDIIVVDQETAVNEPGRGSWVPGSEASSAPAAGTEPGQAGQMAGEEPGTVPPSAIDEANGASSTAAREPGSVSSVADEPGGTSPGAGEGRDGMSSAVDEPGGASALAGGGSGSMSSAAADEANGASRTAAGEPLTTWSAADPGARTGPGATPLTAGASPRAGNASPLEDRDPWTAPPSAGNDVGAGPQPTGGAGSMPATASRTGSSAPGDDRRWREIQGMFVDDPRDSVQQASDLIDTAIEEFLAEVRQRQAALASSWQNREADTEVLRVALKDYRALWAVVRDMPVVSATGGAAAAGGAAVASAGAGGSSFGAGPGGSASRHEPDRGARPA